MKTSATEQTARRVQIFFACWVAYFGYYLCRKSVSPSLAGNQGMFAFSALLSAFGLAYVMGQLLAGWAADRFGGRLVGTVGAGLSALCTAGMTFTPSLAGIFALQIGNGLAQGCGYPAVCKLIGSWFDKEERGVVLAWWSTSYSLGGFLASALLALLAARIDSDPTGQLVFFVPSIVLAVVAVYWYFASRDRPESGGPTGIPAPWNSIVRNGEIQLLSVMYFFLKLTRYALLLWLPFYFVQTLKYSERFAGYTASLFELSGFIGMLAASYISDRSLKHQRYPVGATMLFALAFVCLLHPLVSGLGWWASTISICLMGMLIYGPDVLMTATTVLEATSPTAHGRAAALVNASGSVGQMISPLVVWGLVQHFGWDSVFNFLVVCALISGGLLAMRWDNHTSSRDGNDPVRHRWHEAIAPQPISDR